MNDIELAKAAFHFLRRVKLDGDEAPTFMAVMQWLDRMQQGGAQCPPDISDGDAGTQSEA